MASQGASIANNLLADNTTVFYGDGFASLLSCFQAGGVCQLQMIADFDQTLTTFEGQQCHEIMLRFLDWSALELQDKVAPLLEWHDISEKQRMQLCSGCREERVRRSHWFVEEFQKLSCEFRLGEKGLVDGCVTKSNTHTRSGVQDMFDQLNTYNIPLAIISAGLHQVVDAIFERDSIKLPQGTAIIANDMNHVEVRVTSRNKADVAFALASNHFHKAANDERKHVILLGDKPQDCAVVEKFSNDYKVMKIGFMKGSLTLPARDEEKVDFLRYFDVVLTCDAPMDFVKQLLASISIQKTLTTGDVQPVDKRRKVEAIPP